MICIAKRLHGQSLSFLAAHKRTDATSNGWVAGLAVCCGQPDFAGDRWLCGPVLDRTVRWAGGDREVYTVEFRWDIA